MKFPNSNYATLRLCENFFSLPLPYASVRIYYNYL